MAQCSQASKALRRRAWRKAVVALGGNLGAVPTTFMRALQLLQSSHTHITVVSALYRSVPLRVPNRTRTYCNASVDDKPYSNAVCGIQTLLGPHECLRMLQKIEQTLGRQRSALWGPRTLDLDLLIYADLIVEQRRLTLPHPGIAYRAFVLAPLRDINALHPWPRSKINVWDLLPDDEDALCGILHKQLSWRS